MKHLNSIILVLIMSFLLIFLIILGIHQGFAYIYFSGTRNIYSDGTGLIGMYSGLGSSYNIYALGGLYGMFNNSLYGLSPVNFGIIPSTSMNLPDIYGLGALNRNILGFNGLVGLYGISWPVGLYGIYGPYGLGSLSGVNGISAGLNEIYGILTTMNPFFNRGLFTSVTPYLQTPASIIAEQAGIWTGNWYSYVKISDVGTMDLNLVEDTVNSLLTGEVNLLFNNITASVPARVTGFYNGSSTFILSGGNNTIFTNTLLLVPTATLYSIELNCTLTSPTTISGTYVIQDLVKLFTDDFGGFNLALSSPVI